MNCREINLTEQNKKMYLHAGIINGWESKQFNIEKVKEYTIGNMKMNLESSDSVAFFAGNQELMKRKILSPEEREKNIRKLGSEELREAAKSIFKTAGLNLALVGPCKSTAKLSKIMKNLML